jgi:thiol-disulfide isomerase/thioredoxin
VSRFFIYWEKKSGYNGFDFITWQMGEEDVLGRKDPKSAEGAHRVSVTYFSPFHPDQPLARTPEKTEYRLPHLTGKTLEGVPVSQLLESGKPVMIHFWGTWCPVCAREASNVALVASHYPVLTVAVNSGSPEAIRHWMRKRGVRYPVLNDPDGTLASRFGVEVYPTSFIYDAKGELRFVESGYTTTVGLLARMKLAE